ncbi:MAG TPA: acyltransferase [Brevibacillus sp.]|nr:acyltransferase [Brevibacillus sp.]
MYMDSRIVKSLFILQLLSSFLVFAGHYTALVLNYTDPFWVIALNQISRYGTVFLAIITGFFTARSLERLKGSGWSFFSGKITYIFIPFLLFGVLYHYLLTEQLPSQGTDFLNIILGKTDGQLYFIFMLCQYYVFAYIFRNIINKKNILVLIWVFMIFQYVYINYLHQPWLGLSTRHAFPTWIFTFYLGHIIYWYREEIILFMKNNQPILVGFAGISLFSAILFVLSETTYVAVHMRFVLATLVTLLTGLLFLFDWAEYIPLTFRKGLTFFIYLTHSAVTIIVNKTLIGYLGDIAWIFESTWYTLVYLVIIYCITFGISMLLSKMMNLMETHKRRKIRQIEGSM